MEVAGLDFETYGSVDINKHGTARYMADPFFKPLIGCINARSGNVVDEERFDFVSDRRASIRALQEWVKPTNQWTLAAHFAGFEIGVMDWMGLDFDRNMIIDSSVVARAAGAAGMLEAAAPQLLGETKMQQGRRLINIFSKPHIKAGGYQEINGSLEFDDQVIADNLAAWADFDLYCMRDARQSRMLVEGYLHRLSPHEIEYHLITQRMNEVGWTVDVATVGEMQWRFEANKVEAVESFKAETNSPDINLNSYPQQKAWMFERGIKANSFDKDHIASLKRRIEKKVATMSPADARWKDYHEALVFLTTKEILGGSSLSKLQTILDTSIERDGVHRLPDQYFHCGAKQTWRTTGRSVQMQNLKRLDGDNLADMTELGDPDSVWSNDELATNLRQVFIASDPKGRLIVGDFSSVESRGLAWLALAAWKLKAFRDGKDMYKVLAAKIYSISYDDVLKPQRQTGKVGELACGYGAGGGAVQNFAHGMGVEMTEAEAAQLVSDWRGANPEVERFWQELDDMLHGLLETNQMQCVHPLADGFQLRMLKIITPPSLEKQHPGSQSVSLEVLDSKGERFMVRYFHGCHLRGRDIVYYKPSDRKTGDLWKCWYQHPKTKEIVYYKLYGGKIAGILTQSFCRELFMIALAKVAAYCEQHDNITLIGQFHDEIVVDWRPGGIDLATAKERINEHMSDPGLARSFPLEAVVKDDYRYTK